MQGEHVTANAGFIVVALIQRYLGGLLDPFVTLLEVHKRMYFMQEAGEPLRFQYVKHHYGPYAENLRHVLRAVEGHLIAGYADGGDAPDKLLSLAPGTVKEARTTSTSTKSAAPASSATRAWSKGSSRLTAWSCSLRCMGS